MSIYQWATILPNTVIICLIKEYADICHIYQCFSLRPQFSITRLICDHCLLVTTNCLIFYTRLEELIKRIQSLAESLLLSGDSVVYDILKKGACYSFSYSSMFIGVHSVWNKLIWEYSPRHFLLRLFLCPVVEGLLWLYWLKMAIIFSFGFDNQKLMPGHQLSNHF